MQYWISWYQPTEDHRPLSFPPNENILGWWCTGHSEAGATLCAMVKALSEEEARFHVKVEWPEVEEWRFCEESDGKVGDRFPLSEWMIPRMAQYNDKENV